jgi:FMN phosphatase YigB (HAD superfamily)
MAGSAPYKAVITDMDGTLYSWVDYIVPALEAMVDSLEHTTGMPRIRIVQSLKEVYEKHGTNEYAFAIQESQIFAEFNYDFDSFNALVIWPARRAFSDMRRRYLKPYRGVLEGLAELKERGLSIVALTDAPRGPAERRLKQLELDRHFDALYTLEGFPVPDLVDEGVKEREKAGYYRSAVPRVVELPTTHEKPSPLGIERILSDFGLEKDEVLMVGDNVKKDMAAAQAAGVLGVWAEYGTYISSEYRVRLNTISARAVTRKNVSDEADERLVEPEHAVSNFRRILDIIDGRRAA